MGAPNTKDPVWGRRCESMSASQDPFVERYEAQPQYQMEPARPCETASNGDDNRLIDHDDNWRELEDERDQVFVGGGTSLMTLERGMRRTNTMWQ